ncbi:MAG: DUF72 domain-containing protein [Candidatus Binatia bacterium]
MAEVQVGCCGFPVARESYYSTFKAVEVQQTFYQLPMMQTAQKWRKEAPEGFLFTLKAWQLITHEATSPTYRRLKLKIAPEKEKNYGSFKPTDEVFAAWEATRLFARNLKAEMVVFQCPASFTPESRNKENMVRFFRSLKREGLSLIWEPRGQWRGEEIRELCRELDLIHCVDALKNRPLYGRMRYFRLHGPAGYQSRYGAKDLQKILEICHGEVYCFFNNSFMFEDAMRFLHLVEKGESRREERF